MNNRLIFFPVYLLLFLLASGWNNKEDHFKESRYFYFGNPVKFAAVPLDSLPKPLGWINDFENLFSGSQEKVLDSIIKDFEKKTTVEIAIVTLDSNMVDYSDFNDFIVEIHNHWGIGKKYKNNGVVIGISAAYRRIRISNGYGIERILTDVETKSIIDNYILPHFKNGDYFGGTLSGLNSLIGKLNKEYKNQ